jgi:hypothetical protein
VVAINEEAKASKVLGLLCHEQNRCAAVFPDVVEPVLSEECAETFALMALF